MSLPLTPGGKSFSQLLVSWGCTTIRINPKVPLINETNGRLWSTSMSALDSSTGAGVTPACYETIRNKFRPYWIILPCRQWWCETRSELFLLSTMAVFDDIKHLYFGHCSNACCLRSLTSFWLFSENIATNPVSVRKELGSHFSGSHWWPFTSTKNGFRQWLTTLLLSCKIF